MVTAEEDIYKRWPTRWRRSTVRRWRRRRRTRSSTRTRLRSTRDAVDGASDAVGRVRCGAVGGWRRRRLHRGTRGVARRRCAAWSAVALAASVLWRGLVVNSIFWRTRTCVWSRCLWCIASRRCISTGPSASWSCAPDSSSSRSRPRTWPSSAVSSTGSCSPCNTLAPALFCTWDLRKSVTTCRY